MLTLVMGTNDAMKFSEHVNRYTVEYFKQLCTLVGALVCKMHSFMQMHIYATYVGSSYEHMLMTMQLFAKIWDNLRYAALLSFLQKSFQSSSHSNEVHIYWKRTFLRFKWANTRTSKWILQVLIHVNVYIFEKQ